MAKEDIIQNYKDKLQIGTRFSRNIFLNGRWHICFNDIWEVMEIVERGIVVGHSIGYGHKHLEEWNQSVRDFVFRK